MTKELVIINNENTFTNNKDFFCDNIAMKTIFEGLSNNFNLSIILRKSKINKSHQIKSEKINLSSNIFHFLKNILKTFNNKNNKYLLISITPYTFLSYLLLFIFNKKIYLYLRSDGHEEYKSILGFLGPMIYHIMYIVVTSGSKIITCQKRLTKKESSLVFPSELDFSWISGRKKAILDKPRLLYVGRVKVEKGIFSLLKIFEEIEADIELSIVGRKEDNYVFGKKINYLGYENNTQKLKKIYDDHNIFILPSFTEAHPQVLDEALARERPVIIFEEIAHVVKEKEGIFVCKRNAKSLIEKIEFIINNYEEIQSKVKKNKLPTKESFIDQLSDSLK